MPPEQQPQWVVERVLAAYKSGAGALKTEPAKLPAQTRDFTNRVVRLKSVSF
jgi:hypothetical protein